MNITGIILAGGESSRMGQDKGLLEIKGKPMVAYLIDLLKSMDLPVIIVSNNQDYKRFDVPVVIDKLDAKGPLVGIWSGLEASQSERNLIISCDTPFLYRSSIEKLIRSSVSFQMTIASVDGRLNPLIGIYTKDCAPVIRKQLEDGENKVDLLLSKLKSTVIDFSEHPEQFVNLNAPTDIQALGSLVNVRFFGQLTEMTGVTFAEVLLPAEDIDLREFLNNNYPVLKSISYKIAVDSEFSERITQGSNPKEITVLPPFAGG